MVLGHPPRGKGRRVCAGLAEQDGTGEGTGEQGRAQGTQHSRENLNKGKHSGTFQEEVMPKETESPSCVQTS